MIFYTVFYIIINVIKFAMLVDEENHPKVVGGEPVDLAKFPHACRFYNDNAMCSGVILNSWSVLTSAHCMDMNDDAQLMAVVVGSRSMMDHKGQWLRVIKVVIHEQYNTTVQFSCDLAIVFVDEKIIFGKTVQRVILVNNDKWMSSEENEFKISGWGRTSFNGKVSPELLMTTLHFTNNSICEQLNGIKLSPDIFCLYGYGKKDACRGDSGGGVIWRGMLVGITSHGKGGCSQVNRPSMYANVWYLRDWIRKQVDLFVKDCVAD